MPRYIVSVDIGRLYAVVDAPDVDAAGLQAIAEWEDNASGIFCAGTFEVRETEAAIREALAFVGDWMTEPYLRDDVLAALDKIRYEQGE